MNTKRAERELRKLSTAHMPPSKGLPPSGLRATLSPKAQQTATGAEEDALLDTPADLACPLTHVLFKDPVLTAAGQVYEREAIERHLSMHGAGARDPVTRVPLPSPTVLTPVYLVKARASEYRETTAVACVDKACSQSCRDPVKFVRRAVEVRPATMLVS